MTFLSRLSEVSLNQAGSNRVLSEQSFY